MGGFRPGEVNIKLFVVSDIRKCQLPIACNRMNQYRRILTFWKCRLLHCGVGAVVSAAPQASSAYREVDSLGLTVSTDDSLGWASLTLCQECELSRAYAASGSLSRMYNKLCMRVKWGAAHCSQVSGNLRYGLHFLNRHWLDILESFDSCHWLSKLLE